MDRSAGRNPPTPWISIASFAAPHSGVNRSNDPKIGGSVLSPASQGLSVALSNPIGL
jgi:hypothetical protein